MKALTLNNLLTILTLFIGTSINLYGNNTPNTQESIFDVMQFQEVLEITIESDFTNLSENRKTEEYTMGKITFEDGQEIIQDWSVKLKPRGKYRRRICEMPPLKIKFAKKDLESKGLVRDFNDLKLVTHCTDNRSESKALIAKEYLAYKLYNELTPFSFRVQMVKINYIDTKTGEKFKNFGFLIEDKNQLEARLGAEETEIFGLTGYELPQEQEKLISVFQYMIGNEDWNINLSKNMKFFKKGETIIPVPYDFDFSGLVNAPYARPNVSFSMTSVTERVFMGVYTADADLHATRAYFRSKKNNLYKIIYKSKTLSNSSRNEVVYYLDTFYDNMDDFVVKERMIKKTMATQPGALSR